MATATAAATCRLCPADGGTVVARYPGDGPAHRAADRSRSEQQATGTEHHDHYDPEQDAFIVVRHGS